MFKPHEFCLKFKARWQNEEECLGSPGTSYLSSTRNDFSQSCFVKTWLFAGDWSGMVRGGQPGSTPSLISLIMSGNRAGSAPPRKAQVSPPGAFNAHGESHADVAMLLAEHVPGGRDMVTWMGKVWKFQGPLHTPKNSPNL